MKITCLKQTITVNGSDYPVLMAFISAEDLAKIAEVPSFPENKSHHGIASALRTPPVNQWQRPLDTKRVTEISGVFSDTAQDNLMANPVLVGNAPIAQGRYEVGPKLAKSGSTSVVVPDVVDLEIKVQPGPKPLWILDGQHRIRGLLQSTQMTQPIPVVLLLDDVAYPSEFLAKMFTQVTTEAKPMKSLHGEWMSYAFQMGKYEAVNWQKAMRTSIELCANTSFDGKTNPFLDNIRFNPYDTTDRGFRTIRWDVDKWNKIIATNYFGNDGGLGPQELACQIVRFVQAVVGIDVHQKSRLTQHGRAGHPLLMERFLSTFLQLLAKRPDCADYSRTNWDEFLREGTRKFDKCDWSMTWISTAGSTSGAAHKPSMKTTELAFYRFLFEPEKLEGIPLTTYLKGPDNFQLEGYTRNASGNVQRAKNRHSEPLSGNGGSHHVQLSSTDHTRRDLRVVEAAGSRASVMEVLYKGVSPHLKWKKGDLIDLTGMPNPVELHVVTGCYSSDSRKETCVTVIW